MPSPSALRAAAPGIDRYRHLADLAQRKLNRYAADPFLLLDEGHIRVPDIVTRRPVVLTPYESQRELLNAWIDRRHLADTGDLRFRNVHCEKSRQMGDTWIFAYGFWWAVTFHPVSLLITHLREKKVDDGGMGSTVDSFMGKVRYLHERAPAQIRAPLTFKHLLIRNERSSAFVVGEGATSEPGRGGSYDGGLLDEAARIAYAQSAQAAVVSAIPEGRVYLSTPEGEDELFHAMRETKPAGVTFIRHHWSRHPVYGAGAHIAGTDPGCRGCRGNQGDVAWDAQHPERAHRYPGKLASPWYDRKVAELTHEQVAQELDIDYAGSLTARVYAEFTEEVHVVDGPLFDAVIGYETAWDYGADTTSVVILQDTPRELRAVGEYEIGDSTPEQVAAGLREVLADMGCRCGSCAPTGRRGSVQSATPPARRANRRPAAAWCPTTAALASRSSRAGTRRSPSRSSLSSGCCSAGRSCSASTGNAAPASSATSRATGGRSTGKDGAS